MIVLKHFLGKKQEIFVNFVERAGMNIFSKLWVIGHCIKWRLFWNRRNTSYRFQVEGNPKFMSPRDAAGLIKDGDVCMVPGLAGNQRISIMAWAIRELFEETGHPRQLTLICPGGQGGRGRAPGTLEELGQEGLVARFFCGHQETFKSLLRLAAKGKIELQCLPQGMIILLIEAALRGEDSLISSTGVGTFCDPRVGPGSAIFDPKAEAFITVAGEELRYRLPQVNVAIFNAPAADRDGNIYVRGAATICLTKELAMAVRRTGGRVIANVGKIVPHTEKDIFLPAQYVDAVVFYPDTEQTGSFMHRAPCSYFMVDSHANTDKGVEMVRFINRLLGLTPKRGKVANAVARVAADLIMHELKPGALVNIGTGMPEEVFYELYRQGKLGEFTALTEAGAVGGVPAPGIFFGAAVTPTELVSSVEVFKRAYRHLDATILGALQVDSHGNVNVSKRGEGPQNYVGPGGFIDFTCAAHNIFFVCSWMSHGKITIRNGQVKIRQYGQPKFIAAVDQVTFNGAQALKMGKQVFYITDVGIFQLTSRGMELIRVMPGIDIQKDILAFAPMKVVLSSDKIPLVDKAILTE